MLANIIFDVLVIYRETLLAATAPGGWLCLSGILATELESVTDAFREAASLVWQAEAAAIDSRTDGECADLRLVRAG